MESTHSFFRRISTLAICGLLVLSLTLFVRGSEQDWS
jgi:hypothetical protein